MDNGEDRDLGPHYIAELDPQNPKNKSAILEHCILWLEYVGYASVVAILISLPVAWFFGVDVLFLIIVAVVIIAASLLINIGS